MTVKAQAARRRGFDVNASFIGPHTSKCGYASLINVFSHVNDFDAFLQEIYGVLEDGGELLVETGDMEGLRAREDFPGDLGLVVKKILGRNVVLKWPYSSPYRTMRVRAKKRAVH
jgi:hypothetical protein